MQTDSAKFIDPLKLATENSTLDGQIDFSLMSRLQELSLQPDGTVKYHLSFSRNAQNIPLIKGHVQSALVLCCQRCLEEMRHNIEANFVLAVAASETEFDALHIDEEPLITNGLPISLSELLEDELILNLPLVPKHELNECSVKLDKLFVTHNDSPTEE